MLPIHKRLVLTFGLTFLFLFVQLGAGLVLNDPSLNGVAFADDKKGKNKEKNKLKGNKRLRAAVGDLQGRVEALEAVGIPSDGQDGAQGPVGPAGPQGPKGDTGATGATGPQGPRGIAGATGATGAQGAQGPAGATGPQGPAGADGAGGGASYVMVDGRGNTIGNIISMDRTAGRTTFYTHVTYEKPDGELINLSIDIHKGQTGNRLYTIVSGSESTVTSNVQVGEVAVLFTEQNCDGVALVAPPHRMGNLFRSTAVMGFDREGIVRGPIQVWASTLNPTGDRFFRYSSVLRKEGCSNGSATSSTGWVPAELVDGNFFSTFPLPYSVELAQ